MNSAVRVRPMGAELLQASMRVYVTSQNALSKHLFAAGGDGRATGGEEAVERGEAGQAETFRRPQPAENVERPGCVVDARRAELVNPARRGAAAQLLPADGLPAADDAADGLEVRRL